MVTQRALSVALAACLLGSCGGARSDGPSDTEKQQFASAVEDYMRSKTFQVGTVRPCSEVFDIGKAEVQDTMVSGDRGQLKVRGQITMARPIRNNLYRNGIYVPPECFGGNPSEWLDNQTLYMFYQVTIERWDSGWRLSAPPNIVQVAM